MEYMQPRISRAVGCAIKFLLENSIRSLPVDPAKLALDAGWKLRTYSRTGEKYPVRATAAEVGDMFGSDDAFSFINRRGTPVIVYNDRISSQARISWSIAHEIGHIMLGHFRDFDMSAMNAAQLRRLDSEADAFTANLLAPACIVDALKKPLHSGQRHIFGISERGWEVRLSMLAQDRRFIPEESALALRRQLSDFMYGKICAACGCSYTGSLPCPECGSEKAGWPGKEHAAAEIRRIRIRRQQHSAPERALHARQELENPMLDDSAWGGENMGAYDRRRI